jgi:peptidoglycan/LPS O-acetylase OafA/YrhL
MKLENFNLKKNNFDLIRLLAAIFVIYGHSKAITQSGPNDFFLDLIGYRFIGGVSVAIFFFISGFLVTSSALNNKLNYYISSRVLRIYPGLLAMLLISILLIGPFFTTSLNYFSFETVKYLFIIDTLLSPEELVKLK